VDPLFTSKILDFGFRSPLMHDEGAVASLFAAFFLSSEGRWALSS
jgi:hypothetical protein